MRIHRLTVSAFGPFAGRHSVDFDALGDAGLFLLHGPTGAGKTTLLDAVCFALYAAVPGARASGSPRLRSDHAAPDAAPEVVLDVTLGGRRLEITRSPAWERPKRRGTGTTTEPARTVVRELVAGEWVPRTNRNDEASQLVRDLVGMGLAQFTKVVLLPQGEFAAFLRADAETRRDVLARLFDTSAYGDVEAWLAEERRRLGRRVADVQTRTDALVERAHQAAEPLTTAVVGGAGDGAPIADGLLEPAECGPGELRTPDNAGESADAEEVIGDVTADVTDADDVLAPVLRVESLAERAGRLASAALHAAETAQGEAGAATQHLTDLLALAERAVRRTALDRELVGLTATDDGLARDRERLAAARRAAPVAVHHEAVEHCHEEWRRHAAELAAALHALPADVVAAAAEASKDGDADGWPDALMGDGAALVRESLAQRREDLGRLSTAGNHVAEVARLRSRLARLVAGVEQTQARLRGLRHERASMVTGLRSLQDQASAARTKAATLDAARSDLERARERAAAARSVAALCPRLEVAKDARVRAVDAAQQARQVWLDLRAARLAGMAAELAAGLADGEPCRVCGATEHPSPASGSGPAITVEQETQAADEVERAKAQRVVAERLEAELTTALAEARVAAGGDLTPEAADATVAAQEAVVEAAGAAAESLEALDEACARATQDLTVADEALESLARSEATDTAQRKGVAERLAELEALLEELRGDDPDVPSRDHRLREECSALETLLQARDAEVAAAEATAAARGRAETAARENGWADLTEAAQHVLPAAEVRDLEESVAAREQRRAEVLALLADLDPASLDESVAAAVGDDGLAGLTQAVDAAQETERRTRSAATAAEREHAVLDRAATSLARIAAELREHVEASRSLLTEHRVLDELARCAEGTGGGNALRMRLSSYVLAARLEEVAVVASERLSVMSDGRYSLVHSDERSRGGGRSGLGLKVVDEWTGAARDTATLSGGEAFLASLALALGLADVVQAEAGGFTVETLFVDEGFGTLDEDTLEDVMTVLDSLREGGRAVGVVSHVADLRQRIPARLEVRKSRTGSHLVVHGVRSAPSTDGTDPAQPAA